ncbi:MAG: glycosyltransferase family 2 protein [Desulfomicrobium escambiense]|nr:glycosyltransferase family 2 protein [Desulfomicrobium escambiense]
MGSAFRSIEQNSARPASGCPSRQTEGTDGTLEWARERGFRLHRQRRNIGVCHALNAARTLAAAELLVFFNDDMYACPGLGCSAPDGRGRRHSATNGFMLSGHAHRA